LASFLKDVGISEEQFMTACKDGSGSPQFNGMNRVGGKMCNIHRGFLFSLFIIVESEPQSSDNKLQSQQKRLKFLSLTSQSPH